MLPIFIEKSKIPHKPGVYLYKNQQKQIIYVGKAVDLYSRVSSYFSGPQYPRTATLVKEIAGLETIIVESEVEALILEANLIKQYLPQYNIKLIDDKDYLYIKVSKEDFPKILTARKKELSGSLDYFGPFPSASTVKTTLKRLRRIFPWCTQGIGPRPCFYYHLGLCAGICAGVIKQKEYRQIIKRFIQFMKGNSKQLVDELTIDMNQASKTQKYEEAANLKKIIEGVNYLLQPNQVHLYLENPNFLDQQRRSSLCELQKVLNIKTSLARVEMYDISNIQGKNATGSMVVLTNGEIDKSQYRKFKIIISGRPNDVGMMSEMLNRRLKHREWPLPQLLLLDGGRGQARTAAFILKQINLQIPVFALAKQMEWLYHPEEEIIKLPKSSLAIRLLQKLRDEAHRFALNYHRQLRSKTLYT
ncbi:hypothetical protein A3H85_01510 [Candidatus Daviesbacteria bacterium RIFCSPLOWO2_02_FULL_40_8]|uniref:Excinuclease ABC subunit C n=1 Tax=Candidatus Daviesbacteria bacterium RIFCSPLOWO2_01_FULL_40_24 TaxID=1797787 RepID=A0A1F5MK53_9BACT|nr:MAG: hypothetical protein A2780_01235 [Candidatus Daviesbacteria bacterium RIFCSPHIGHO2_01_FULL_41_45]OGE34424.1 MAG: hypothetical protein A3C32_03695 [Candidatus Daviesbacteria bacterium RIFCSPHIGHO2_02_FULL_41_14]OGE65670.1 MAG: hypothetical protein A3B49_03690 [Candidatus Daviesbacteria bacterium RIFCSPLOWO2_01_FULL_40_24]OGE66745.1 MAG: hypothetical protein A3H85_01510 [Candidatus Daviesbacteria bacterium RIFCSPLOWO2_02_FULL_40_8]